MKQILCLILIAAMVLPLLTACGTSEPPIETVSAAETTLPIENADLSETERGLVELGYPIYQVNADVPLSEDVRSMLYAMAGTWPSKETSYNQLCEGTAFGFPISIPVDWSCKDVTNRSVCYRFHGLLFLDLVWNSWRESGEPKYRDLIISYVLDWLDNNPVVMEGNEWAWHDDATARRVARLSVYYDAFQDAFTPEQLVQLKASLQDQATLLATEDFYNRKHNHGMYQDIGLISYALLVTDDLAEKDHLLTTALSRTGEYFHYAYARDGIHKEHSVSYALDITKAADQLSFVLRDYSPDFSNELRELTENNISFLLHATMPNGAAAPIGDNVREDSLWSHPLLADSPEAEYVRTGGTSGTPPSTDIVYDEGGYAIFRSAWEDAPEEATWLLFQAATHSSTHKHGDDLAFLLYHRGDLFVEAGPRDYNYLEPQTSWCYSSYAHNVLTVNGQHFPVKIGTSGFHGIYPEAKNTHITDFDLSDSVSTVTGYCERFENAKWERTVSYDKAGQVVTLTDAVDATESLDATFQFHLAEGITPVAVEGGWELYRGTDRIATVTAKGSAELTLKTVTEATEEAAPHYPWIFNGQKEPVIGSVLLIDMPCTEGGNTVTTTITLH